MAGKRDMNFTVFGVFFLSFLLGTSPVVAQRDSYDYIVVGSGAAGSIVAARLSEDPSVTVALLEAGGDASDVEITQVPFLDPTTVPSLEWGFSSVPQTGLDGRVINLPRAKMIGGCSRHNGMFNVRGNAGDYDSWEALGNSGWSFDEVLPIFVEMENRTEIDPNCDQDCQKLHSTKGPMRISLESFPFDLNTEWLSACSERNIPLNDDPNGADQFGCSFLEYTIYEGTRWSVQEGYLDEVEDERNLDILTFRMVTKIEFDTSLTPPKAIGVRYREGQTIEELQNAEERLLLANQEVIISAGAFNSPQLLMLSGIGPASELSSLNIAPMISPLEGVGLNYQDHAGVAINFATSDLNSFTPNDFTSASLLTEWEDTHSGLFTVGFYGTTSAYLQSDQEELRVGSGAPDIQIVFSPGITAPIGSVNRAVAVTPRVLHPKSRGTVTLSSNNPLDPPLLDPNYLEDERDIELLLEGIEKSIHLMESKALKDSVGHFLPGPVITAACGSPRPLSHRDYWECYIRNNLGTRHHPVGTCQMGSRDNPEAVVNERLEVYGVSGLRVCDASIMPTETSGNTATPVYMIGEKCAQLIKSSKL